MTREEAKKQIVEILKTVHTIDQNELENVTEKTDFITDLGAPSTELVNIIVKLEDKFGIEFDDQDVDEVGSTVGETIDLVLKYVNK